MTVLMRQARIALLGTSLMLSMALPGQAEDTRPDTLRETFRDWSVICGAVSDAAAGAVRACEMVQQINHQDTGLRLLAMSVQIDATGQPVVVLLTPFGLRLVEGVRIRIGAQDIAHLAFDTCLPEGCLLTAAMEAPLIAAMQDGSAGEAVMVARQGNVVGVRFSLMGFTAALERLRALAAG